MNKNLKQISRMLLVAGLWAASRAQAGITIDTDINGLQNATAGKTAIVIADMNNSGVLVSDLQLSAGTVNSQWSLDSNDKVLGVYQFTAPNLTASVNASPLGVNLPSGTDLYVVWYPTLAYNASLTAPGAGKTFGVYRDTLGDQGYGAPYIGFDAPASDGAYTLYREAGIDGYNGASLSGVQTIPEPSSAMLVLCGLGLARIIRRRRNS